MIRNQFLHIHSPDLEHMTQVTLDVLGVASTRIILRKTTTALKPKYKPLVNSAKSSYQRGTHRRSGATAEAFGFKAWHGKKGTPRSAVVVGLHNKSGLKKFQAWQQRARNRYEAFMKGKQKHPTPKRLTDPNYHKPSKILHLIDEKVRAHPIKVKNRKALAAPEKATKRYRAIWGTSVKHPGSTGVKKMQRIHKTGARILFHYGPTHYARAFETVAGQKLARSLKRMKKVT